MHTVLPAALKDDWTFTGEDPRKHDWTLLNDIVIFDGTPQAMLIQFMLLLAAFMPSVIEGKLRKANMFLLHPGYVFWRVSQVLNTNCTEFVSWILLCIPSIEHKNIDPKLPALWVVLLLMLSRNSTNRTNTQYIVSMDCDN